MIDKQYQKGLRPWHLIHVLRNSIDFPIRNLIRWNRPLPAGVLSEPSLLLSHFNEQIQGQAEFLWHAYHLPGSQALATFFQQQVNLYYLDLFVQAFTAVDMLWPADLCAADVGPSDWFYLPALYHFLRYFRESENQSLVLEGYEVDPYRVYADLHARHNHAAFRCAAYDQVTYFQYGFKTQPERFDVLLQCFPFLFLKDHLSWGLPLSLFDPQGLFQKLETSLKPGGCLLIINQGSAEQKLQKKLVEDSSLKIVKEFLFHSVYKTYQKEHFVMVLKK